MKPDVAIRCRVCGKEWTKEEIQKMLGGKEGIEREKTIAKLWRDHLIKHMPPHRAYMVFMGGMKQISKFLEVDVEWLEKV